MCNERLNEIMVELKKPFHPSEISWKPGAVKGERALAMPYADLRAYMNRLDDVCGSAWSIEYEPWGEDRIICKLTICGVTRSSTGESNKESDRNEIGGTVAEAQAAKRACAFFGLGRYLYNLPTGWADYDPAVKKFTDKAKAKLTGILVQHYRRATDPNSKGMDDLFAEPQDAPHATPTPQTAQRPSVDADESFGSNDNESLPSEEEIAIINQWDGARDAQNWAIMVGACDNEHHASQSWIVSVKACNGYSAKNKREVMLHFVRHQREKLGTEQSAA